MAKQHRGYAIWYDPKPIPLRQFDWDWCHEDYDGPGDEREGHAATFEAAKAAIDEQIEQEEQEEQDRETALIIGRVRNSDRFHPADEIC